MSADSALLREVTIKTGVVKRLVKEVGYYVKDAEKESNKLDALKAQGDADEYTIKKQHEIYQDSQQMIPECTRRVQKSVEELKALIENNADVLKGTTQFDAACEQIEEASKQKI